MPQSPENPNFLSPNEPEAIYRTKEDLIAASAENDFAGAIASLQFFENFKLERLIKGIEIEAIFEKGLTRFKREAFEKQQRG